MIFTSVGLQSAPPCLLCERVESGNVRVDNVARHDTVVRRAMIDVIHEWNLKRLLPHVN